MPVSLFASAYGPDNSSTRTRMTEWVRRVRSAAGKCEIVVAAPFIGSLVGRTGVHNGKDGSDARRTATTGAAAIWNAARRAETVFVQRNVASASTGHLEAMLLRRAALGVYDIDDGLPWDTGNVAGGGAARRVVKRVLTRAAIARRAASAADRVIAGNELLAEWASGLCRDVVVIPTCVAPTDYRQKDRYELRDPPVIGWIGSPATTRHVASIAPALVEVHRRTGAQLHLVGARSDEAGLAPLRPFTTYSAWTMAAQHDVLAGWDVGIMPLPDDPYERAKCGYKLLQYGAAGLPAVASPVGVNADIARRAGIDAPATIDDWVDALGSMLGATATATATATARCEGARRLQGLVRSEFSYDAWHDRWIAAVSWSG